MEAIIEQHAAFFDGLVNLIPAKHYYDSRDELVNTKYLKKDAKAEQKKAFKQQYKDNKRQKLNPDLALTTLKAQQLEANKRDLEDGTANDGSPQAKTAAAAISLGSQAFSRGELQQKLRQRISEHKQQRKNDTAQAAKDWLNSKRQEAKQKLKASLQSKKKPEEASGREDNPSAAAGITKPRKDSQEQQQHKKDSAQTPAFDFGRIEVDGSDKKRHEKKKTKAQLLQEAEAKQQQLKQLEASNEGKEIVRQEAWRSALMRAKGEKVLDDPKLLRKSLKNENKKKARNTKAWQERQQQQETHKAARQQKRTDNLQSRTQVKFAKKKERREKKLLRAGFEGRKDTVIGGK